MRAFRILMGLLICGAAAMPLKAQYPYIHRPVFADQLGTQVIFDMLATKNGYMWLSTDKGLYRFNGRTFTRIPFDSTKTNGLGYLREDEEGTIWCMNFYKEIFRLERDTLRNFTIRDVPADFNTNFLNLTVRGNDVWLNSFHGLYAIDKKTGKFRTQIRPLNNTVFVFSQATKDGICAYTYSGWLLTVNQRGFSWKKIGLVSRDLFMSFDGEYLYGGSMGTNRSKNFMVHEGVPTSIPAVQIPDNEFMLHYTVSAPGETWICTLKGAYRWDPTTGKAVNYFPGKTVTDVVKDYQGNYWVSTLDNGLFICPSLGTVQYDFFKKPDDQNNITRILNLPGDRIAVGSSTGQIAVMQKKENRFFRYDLPQSREIEFLYYDYAHQKLVSNRYVLADKQAAPLEKRYFGKSAAKDRFGNLIVASFQGTYIMKDAYGKADKMPDRNCKLYEKLAFALPNGDDFSAILLRLKRSTAVEISKRQDRFWVTYIDDLYEYHYDGTIRIIKDAGGKSITGTSITEMPDGRLAVGTSTDGVIIVNGTLATEKYTQGNGLRSNNIRKCVYGNGKLWVLTDESIQQIDLDVRKVNDIFTENNLANIIVNDFVLDKHQLWIATTQGVIVRSALVSKQEETIRFPDLQVFCNGAKISNDTSMGYGVRNILIQADALHYISPATLQYRYRLLGADSAWKKSDPYASSFVFNRLPFGKYRFEIQAMDANGFYTSEVRNFSFTIRAPFWLHWGFIFASVGLIVGLIIFSLARWKKQLLQKQSVKELLLRSQLTALRAQMTPHFLYNVLNTVQGLVYGNRKAEASALLGNFSDLMRKNLQSSDKQFLSLSEEIENLRLYLELEKARFDKGFSFDISVQGIQDLDAAYIPSMLLQPFAENSVKHGLLHKDGPKKLQIIFEPLEEGIRILIEDNGIGRKRAGEINSRNRNKPASFATGALGERMVLFSNLYNREISYTVTDLEDENGEPSGTRVTVIMPFYETDPSAS